MGRGYDWEKFDRYEPVVSTTVLLKSSCEGGTHTWAGSCICKSFEKYPDEVRFVRASGNGSDVADAKAPCGGDSEASGVFSVLHPAGLDCRRAGVEDSVGRV